VFASILVAVDDSECAQRALAIAIDVALARKAKLTIATVVDPVEASAAAMAPYTTVQPFLEALTENAHQLVDGSVATAKKAGVPADGLVLDGSPIATLVDLARRERVDLVVIGSHGRKGFSRLIAGSVAEGVTREVACPTLIVHDDAGTAAKHR
jgi:nucleotide-binding universal stress UspA family protein